MRPAEGSPSDSHGIGVYVHIPYCAAKCPYCDFNSVAASSWPEDEYVHALTQELSTYSHLEGFSGRRVATIYFGGGTPSLFSAASLERVVLAATRLWPCDASVEVTVEANPGSVDFLKLKAFRDVGINRLSLGVQSFNDRHLELLGRLHSAFAARRAVETAYDAGFENVNVDLIYAIPGQTLSDWERDLQQACALRPSHVSAYNLTYEEGTPFYAWRRQGRLLPVDEETEIAMFLLAETILTESGYRRYEISNYATPSFACRHNLIYWTSQPYVGVGAGAHGYSPVGGAHGWGFRWANERHPRRYIERVLQEGHACVSVDPLDRRRAAGEFMFLGLRCTNGIDNRDFLRRFGKNPEDAFPVMTRLLQDGLVERTASGWRLSQRGTLLADSVFAEFV